MRLIDLAGRRFAQLAVQSRAPNNRKDTMWLCVCDCGKSCVVRGDHLTRGHIKSCGCLSVALARVRNSTHGATKGYRPTPTYAVWQAMRRRCTDPKDNRWQYYGGRGITVCDRWNSFENFAADMGEKPKGLTIDRVNSDGNYEPGNCVWATVKQQSRNRRIVHKMMWDGKLVAVSAVSELLGIRHGRVACRAHRKKITLEASLREIIAEIPRAHRVRMAERPMRVCGGVA